MYSGDGGGDDGGDGGGGGGGGGDDKMISTPCRPAVTLAVVQQ